MNTPLTDENLFWPSGAVLAAPPKDCHELPYVPADLARKLESALREIARYNTDQESIWTSDREGAATDIISIAREALGENQ